MRFQISFSLFMVKWKFFVVWKMFFFQLIVFKGPGSFCRPRCGTQRGPDYKLNWTIWLYIWLSGYLACYVCGSMIIGQHTKCCLVIGYKISNITRLIRNHGSFLYIRKAFKSLVGYGFRAGINLKGIHKLKPKGVLHH